MKKEPKGFTSLTAGRHVSVSVAAGFEERTTFPKTSVQAASSSSSGASANASPGVNNEPGIEDGESDGNVYINIDGLAMNV